ncbi:MAG TPA: GxxExxY protein [Candidatus Eisenbacteria bacterium]|nr:GxxExxY protein [Candidatus Eisenbacteria bacterium]
MPYSYYVNEKSLTHTVLGAAISIQRSLGPGLLQAVYEECLAREFALIGLSYERQKPVPHIYKDLKLECGCRLDFLVKRRIVVELKSVEALAPIHDSIMLTYLRLSGAPLGILINFNVSLLKDGIKRFVSHYN